MKLIPNWKKCWRMFSVWAYGLVPATAITWASMPQEWKDVIPDNWVLIISVVYFVFGVLVRNIKQDKVNN